MMDLGFRLLNQALIFTSCARSVARTHDVKMAQWGSKGAKSPIYLISTHSPRTVIRGETSNEANSYGV
jgi:hypothetical protein